MLRTMEMRNLTEGLLSSSNQRMATLAGLRTESQNVRAAAAATRSRMAERQQRDLHSDRTTRRRNMAGWVSGMAAGRAAAAADQRSSLAEDRAERHRQTLQFLSGSCAARSAMARGQGTALTEARATRQQEVDSLRAGARIAIAQVAFAHEQMAQDLGDQLAKDRSERAHTVDALLSSLRSERQAMTTAQADALAQGQGSLRTSVGDLLAGFANERQSLASSLREMGQIWASFHPSRTERREGVSVPEQGGRPEMVEVTPVVGATAAPETVVPSVEDNQALPSAQAVFIYLADHPDGLRLTDLEERFSTPRIQMARLLRRLMDENKVRKEDMLYFAT